MCFFDEPSHLAVFISGIQLARFSPLTNDVCFGEKRKPYIEISPNEEGEKRPAIKRVEKMAQAESLLR